MLSRKSRAASTSVVAFAILVASFAALPAAAEPRLAALPQSRVMYSGQTAAAYADKYWNSYNSTWPKYSDDCTNFVSQALYAGGLPMTGWGSFSPALQQWWSMTNAQGGRADNTWTVADDLFWYLKNYSGATTYIGTWYGSQGSPSVHPYTPSSEVTGDPIFYDWTNDGTWNHAALQTGLGTTSDGYSGNYIDQHTNSRYHVFWSGWTNNSYRNTTRFGFIHMIS